MWRSPGHFLRTARYNISQWFRMGGVRTRGGSVIQPQLSQLYAGRVAPPYGFPYSAPGQNSRERLWAGKGGRERWRSIIRKIQWNPQFLHHFHFLGPLRIKNFDKTFMSIEWSKPLFDGGESVTGYSIEIRDASRIDWVSSPTIEKLNWIALMFCIKQLFFVFSSFWLTQYSLGVFQFHRYM